MKNKTLTIALLFISTLFATFLIVKLQNKPSESLKIQSNNSQTSSNISIKSLTATTINNKTLSFKDLAGKVVFINFWATWCPPCVAEVPHFVKLQKKYPEKFQMIGISLDSPKTATNIPDFLKKHSVNYPIIMANSEFTKLFGDIQSIPTTFFIDKDLTIIESIKGYRDFSYFETKLKSLL